MRSLAPYGCMGRRPGIVIPRPKNADRQGMVARRSAFFKARTPSAVSRMANW